MQFLYENCVAKDSGLPYNQLVMLAQLFGLQLDVVDQVTVHSCGIGTKLLALISLPCGALHWVAMTRTAADQWVGSDSLWAHPVRMSVGAVGAVVDQVASSDAQLGLMMMRATDFRLQPGAAVSDTRWPAFSMEALRLATGLMDEPDRPKRASDLHALDCSRLRTWCESLNVTDRLNAANRTLSSAGACVVNADDLLRLRSGSPAYHVRQRVNESSELKSVFGDSVFKQQRSHIMAQAQQNQPPSRDDVDVVCTVAAPGGKIPPFLVDSHMVKKVIVDDDSTTSMVGPKDADHSTMMIRGGALYNLAQPRLQLKPKITMVKTGSTWPNDALMREFEWLVGLITGEDVELQRESWTVLRAAVGAVQQLHLDWDKEAMETILGAIDQQFWKRVYVMLYYPKGGTNVNGQGEVQLLKGGDMLLFDGYRYVHAAGPEVKGCVRVHAVLTVRDDDVPYYDVASSVQTSFLDDPSLSRRVASAVASAGESDQYRQQLQHHNKKTDERLRKNVQVSQSVPLQLAHQCACKLRQQLYDRANNDAAVGAATADGVDADAGALLRCCNRGRRSTSCTDSAMCCAQPPQRVSVQPLQKVLEPLYHPPCPFWGVPRR